MIDATLMPDVPKTVVRMDAVRYGQADAARLIHEQVGRAIPMGEFDSLDDDVKQYHLDTLKRFQKLEKNPHALPLLSKFAGALRQAKFQDVEQSLSSIKGADQIVSRVKNNYIKQVDRLFNGGADILHNSHAIVRDLGFTRKFNSLQEIEDKLVEMKKDIKELHTFIHSIDKPDVQGILARIHKFNFDGKNLERDSGQLSSALIIQDISYPGLSEELRNRNIVHSEVKPLSNQTQFKQGEVAVYQHERPMSTRKLRRKIELRKNGDSTTDNILLVNGDIPKTVIIDVPTPESLDTWHSHLTYQEIREDWYRLPEDLRPKVIMVTHDFEPDLMYKHDFQEFLFCTSLDELGDVLSITNRLDDKQANDVYAESALAKGQREAYNNSDLREWENHTADTYQSLRMILHRIQQRHQAMDEYDKKRYSKLFDTDQDGNTTFFTPKRETNIPLRKIHSILDLGTGEGRIGGMLSRLGFNVMGLDLSETQLSRIKKRILEEGEGLRGEQEHPGLTYEAVNKLIAEGLISQEALLDDATAEKNYIPVEGSFFELEDVLNQELVNWVYSDDSNVQEKYAGRDPFKFFDTTPMNQYVFRDKDFMFSDVGFDMAMFNWNTFCETGSSGHEKEVLKQILNVLWPGGELVLEIPDRNIEPYASALKKYHAEHPDEPYGTIRDPKPADFQGLDGEELYPPRYFPDVNELVQLLKSVGYEIDATQDVQSYLVTGKDPQTGEESLTLKEYFITARKSK